MDALARIKGARSALILSQPFWGCLSLNLKLQERPDIDTAATDGESLFYNAEFINSLRERELVGLIAHEVEHVARLHCFRRGTRDARLWNIACDLAINEGLRAAGFHLPEGALFNPRFKGQSAEAIYKALAREEQNQRQKDQQGQGAQAPGSQGQPQPGQGQGQGAPDPGRCGGVLDSPAPQGEREAAEARAQAQIRQAAAVARRAGSQPGAVAEALGEISRGRNPWREILRRFADQSSLKDTSWLRRSRRSSGAVILPSQVSIAPAHVVCVVDSSGSMDRSALRAIVGELQALLDEQAADQISLIQCDTAVRKVATYQPGDVIDGRIEGRGGTAFAPALAYIASEIPDASAILYLTDLDCDSWGEEPACPVLWAATERPRPVPWGEVVEIDAHA